MARRTAIVACVVASILVLPAETSAQQRFSRTPSEGFAGATDVTVTGACEGQRVGVDFRQTGGDVTTVFHAGDIPVGPTGSFSGSVRVPELHPGPAEIVVECWGGGDRPLWADGGPFTVLSACDAAPRRGSRPAVARTETGFFFRPPPDNTYPAKIWYLRAELNSGIGDCSFEFGRGPHTPVMGDWNGDGRATPGLFHDGVWSLRFSETPGEPERTFVFGQPGDVPVVGDWNNDGTDTPGVFRRGIWYLRNSNTAGVGEGVFRYGNPHDVPVVGDWNNDGTDTLGVFRSGQWWLSNFFHTGRADAVFAFGNPGDRPVVGDWNNDGTDTLGVFRTGRWYVSNFFDRGAAEIVFDFGSAGDAPLAWR